MSVYFRLQSTRPVWGATCQTHSDFVEPGISIHAPAWGATWAFGWWYDIPLFQSTRPREARLSIGSVFLPMLAFQSTRPRRARPNAEKAHIAQGAISIHAPA